MKIVSEGGRVGPCGRFLITAAIAVAIILATLFFAVRTEGGLSFIEDWLEAKLGLGVSVAQASIGWPYDLVLRDVVTEGFDVPGSAGMRADNVRIGFFGKARFRVRVEGGEVVIKRRSPRQWMPEKLSMLGRLTEENIAGISRLTRGLRQKMTLECDDCSIRWLDDKGSEFASAGGVAFQMAPVRFPGGRMHYYCVEIYNVLEPGGQRVHDVKREWLASDVDDYIEINRGRLEPAVEGHFWNPGSSLKDPAEKKEPADQ